MARTQVNVKLDDRLLREMESLVESKEYASKTEVFVEALRLLLRTQRGKDLLKRIDEIREGTEQYPSVSKALIEDHEQEDAGIGQAHCRVHSLPYHSRRKRQHATSSQIA